jgi:hypothetical protein
MDQEASGSTTRVSFRCAAVGEPGGERQGTQDEHAAGRRREDRRGDEDGVEAELAAGGNGQRHARMGEFPAGRGREGDEGQVGARPAGRADRALPAAHRGDPDRRDGSAYRGEQHDQEADDGDRQCHQPNAGGGVRCPSGACSGRCTRGARCRSRRATRRRPAGRKPPGQPYPEHRAGDHSGRDEQRAFGGAEPDELAFGAATGAQQRGLCPALAGQRPRHQGERRRAQHEQLQQSDQQQRAGYEHR